MGGAGRFPFPVEESGAVSNEAEWFGVVEASLDRMCTYLNSARGHIVHGWSGLTADAAEARVLKLRKIVTDMESDARANKSDLVGLSSYVSETWRKVRDIQVRWDACQAELATHISDVVSEVGNTIVKQCRPTPQMRAGWEMDALDAEYARVMGDLATERERVMRLVKSRALPPLPPLLVGEAEGIIASMSAWDSATMLMQLMAGWAEAKSGGPKDVAAWWDTLTETDRALLMACVPAVVGATDGIPAMARDHANRTVLAADKQRIESEIARLEEELRNAEAGTESHDRLSQELAKCRGDLAVIRSVEKTIGPAPVRGTDWDIDWSNKANDNYRSLLVWDLNGDGQPLAAVGVGNVGGADHVGIFTPGNGTTVQGDLDRYTTDMQNLAKAARDATDDSVAMVAWLGYEAPQLEFPNNPDLSLLTAGRAQVGAVSLASFSNGIHHSHTGDPHLTLVGHSYGSTTSGIAAENGLSRADDLVVFGSPGVGFGEKVMGDDHVYALEAEGDLITAIPHIRVGSSFLFSTPFEPLGEASSRYTTLETGAAGGLKGVSGHSEYLDENTTSQRNIAQVIAGTNNFVAP